MLTSTAFMTLHSSYLSEIQAYPFPQKPTIIMLSVISKVQSTTSHTTPRAKHFQTRRPTRLLLLRSLFGLVRIIHLINKHFDLAFDHFQKNIVLKTIWNIHFRNHPLGFGGFGWCIGID